MLNGGSAKTRSAHPAGSAASRSMQSPVMMSFQPMRVELPERFHQADLAAILRQTRQSRQREFSESAARPGDVSEVLRAARVVTCPRGRPAGGETGLAGGGRLG